MTKTMKNKKPSVRIPNRRTSGFTLIEMLVVAALIAIFAGLAVFNIIEQLNREKEKAAIAETRSIATAMSFAHDDLGFFPKLCFLKFGNTQLIDFITDEALPSDAVDWFSLGGPAMGNRIQTKWGEKYMAGGMPDKFINMTVLFRSGGSHEFEWPADPYRQPYVGYFVKIEPPEDAGGETTIEWADESLGDEPNYFAGIVSYGRNKVPGGAWNDPTVFDDRSDVRLYNDNPAGTRNFTMIPPQNLYNQARLDVFVDSVADPDTSEPWDGTPPNMRDEASDDIYFEF